MLTIETSNVRISQRALKPAIIFSVFFHGLLILFLENDTQFTTATRAPLQQYFEVSLVAPKPAAAAKKLAHAKTKLEQNANQPKSTAPASQSPATTKAPSNQVTASHSNKLQAIDWYSITTSCNELERKTKARNCGPGEDSFANYSPRPYQTSISAVFIAEPTSVSQQYQRDINRIETLLSMHKMLEKNIGESEEQLVFLANEQQRIIQEIKRIDAGYKEVDLLQVLGVGIKIAKESISQ